MGTISFYNEDVPFQLQDTPATTRWLHFIIISEGFTLNHLNYIFCSDSYLLRINQKFLSHDYYTDIITFNSSSESGVIEGDIFISYDRVMENAFLISVPFDQEMNRVMAHGLLHLLGYDDATNDLKQLMRAKEDSYLSLLFP